MRAKKTQHALKIQEFKRSEKLTNIGHDRGIRLSFCEGVSQLSHSISLESARVTRRSVVQKVAAFESS